MRRKKLIMMMMCVLHSIEKEYLSFIDTVALLVLDIYNNDLRINLWINYKMKGRKKLTKIDLNMTEKVEMKLCSIYCFIGALHYKFKRKKHLRLQILDSFPLQRQFFYHFSGFFRSS